jgi:hypothetical protein
VPQFGAATAGRQPVDLGGPRQRAVLGRLVVAGGHVVSTDRLVDDLWESSDVPAKALAVLQDAVPYAVTAAREAAAVGAWGESLRQRRSVLRLHEMPSAGFPARRTLWRGSFGPPNVH